MKSIRKFFAAIDHFDHDAIVVQSVLKGLVKFIEPYDFKEKIELISKVEKIYVQLQSHFVLRNTIQFDYFSKSRDVISN